MPTVQALKKKLQVILSTRKLTKAMKTAATVKYSKLNALYSGYAKYEAGFNSLYADFADLFNEYLFSGDKSAPVCYLLITSNKGMCGSFNSELLSFFQNEIKKDTSAIVLCCGKKGKEFLEKNKIPFFKSYVFDDIPSYSEAQTLFDDATELLASGKISAIKVVYPQYINMIKQQPACRDLFSCSSQKNETSAELFVPDKQTVINNSAKKLIACLIYKKILETALGAQAATLTTMRSAYDTACEYSVQLEGEINRKRQSQVTADVIEVSAEYATQREE